MSGELMSKPRVDVGVRVGVGCVNKNFNLDHNLNTIRGRAFIFHMYVPYDKTFHTVP